MFPRLLISSLILLSSLVLAVPKIGITPDYYDYSSGTDGSISFSGQIEFDDKSIPHDPAKMTDEQLVNLAKVAYDEMVGLWESYLVEYPDLCPSVMVAMESEGSIYFASSIKSSDKDSILARWANIEGSPANYISKITSAFIGHRTGGCCGEPNSLYFYAEQNRVEGEEGFKRPPTTNGQPRMAVWLRDEGENVAKGTGRAEKPCYTIERGWGCDQFMTEYKISAVGRHDPNPAGQDDWKFKVKPNTRNTKECAPRSTT